MSKPKIFDLIKRVKTLEDKNIITTGISNGITVSSGGDTIMLLDKQIARVGNKLTISNGKVVIGKGVNHVLVSGKFNVNVAVTNRAKNFYLRKNGDTNIAYAMTFYSGSANANLSETLSPALIEVEEGDYIEALYYLTPTDYIMNQSERTYITVEVVE